MEYLRNVVSANEVAVGAAVVVGQIASVPGWHDEFLGGVGRHHGHHGVRDGERSGYGGGGDRGQNGGAGARHGHQANDENGDLHSCNVASDVFGQENVFTSQDCSRKCLHSTLTLALRGLGNKGRWR